MSDRNWLDNLHSEAKHRRNFFLANRKLLESHAEPKSLRKEKPKKKFNYEEAEIQRKAAVKQKIFAEIAELKEKLKLAEYVPMRISEPRCIESQMREVPHDVIEIRKEPHGTKKYMIERSKTAPREKYYLRETTYFDYAWFSPLSTKGMKRFPRFHSVYDAMYRRRCINEPLYNQNLVTASPTVCTVAKT